MLSLREDLKDHPEMKPVIERIERAFTNPNKAGFARMIERNFRIAEVVTPEGIILGKARDYRVNLGRIKRGLLYTLKGLFWHERKSRIPDDYEMLIFTPEDMEIWNDNEWTRMEINLNLVLKHVKPKVIGNRAFCYWAGFKEGNFDVSVWLMLFFDRLPIIAITRTQQIARVRS